jgi:hypothetical protein
MYHNGQVVHNLRTGEPCLVSDEDEDSLFVWKQNDDTVHYIERNPKYDDMPKPPSYATGFPPSVQINGHEYRYADYRREQEYSIATPKTVEEAVRLLADGLIQPAPLSPEYLARRKKHEHAT